MRNRLALFAVAALLLTSNTFAAKFDYGEGGAIVLSGPIVPGDYDRMLWLMSINTEQYLNKNTIVLASDGGDVAEALKLARLVNSLLATVWVDPKYGRCVSACFLIFVSGNTRWVEGDDTLGVHRPYLDDARLAGLSPADAKRTENMILKSARGYLEEHEVPNYLIEEMFRRASNDVYWLSPEDIAQLGSHSRWFEQYLVAKCGYRKDGLDRESYMKLFACQDKTTLPTARKVLREAMEAAARKDKSDELEGIRGALLMQKIVEEGMARQARCAKDPTCPTHEFDACMQNHSNDGSKCGLPTFP
jgi:hypothetical protein